MWGLPLFPVGATDVARQVDDLYFFLVAVGGFFSLLISVSILTFVVKYRRRQGSPTPPQIKEDLRLEIAWIVIPFALTIVMFVWGASLYIANARAPKDADEISVVGKQWMWKLQHESGRREINELHVPLGRAIKLTMTSEDVIHSFYVPAFRIKMDVLPGKYTSAWFEATRPGRYHLFCAEYCGTEHSRMIGTVFVLEPARYQEWLSGAAVQETPAQAGARLFQSFACHTCHAEGPTARGPALAGVFERTVTLTDGRRLIAGHDYLRESVLDPQAKIVLGYEPIMPSYRGQLSEDDILSLIAYIRSLGSASPKEAR
jgi:cytochrome c oxidase subunit II